MMMLTGKEFRKWRRMNDLTQMDIEREIGIDRTLVSKFENGKVELYGQTYQKLMKFVLEYN